jgi:hypothetical protein
MPHQYTTADLVDAINNLQGQTLTIGPYQFTVTPFSFVMRESQIYVSYPAYRNIIRFDYGQHEREFDITGFFENGGVTELKKSEKIRPLLGTGPANIYPLVFPFFGITESSPVSVYIDSFEASADQSMPNYIQYQIVAHEYPTPVPQAVQVVTAQAGIMQATSAFVQAAQAVTGW